MNLVKKQGLLGLSMILSPLCLPTRSQLYKYLHEKIPLPSTQLYPDQTRLRYHNTLPEQAP